MGIRRLGAAAFALVLVMGGGVLSAAADDMGTGADAAVEAAQEAVAPGYYTTTASGGHGFSVLTSNNLFPTSVDDATVTLSTTGTGIYRLPFAPWIYNARRTSLQVSTNGNIQFYTNTAAWVNECLPSTFGDPSGAGARAIAVYWDDLYVNRTLGDGVYTKTSGSAPNRKFTVSWQVHELGTGAAVRAQVILFENNKKIRMQYGRPGGASATVGVQLSTLPPNNIATNYLCNPGYSALSSGWRVDFIHRL